MTAQALATEIGYDRARDLAALDLSELAKIEIGEPEFPDDLDALSREQLRTSLILFALCRAKRRNPACLPALLQCFREEQFIRDEQSDHESMLRGTA